MQKKQLNLALQGGGGHGAYTWGVLDRLLNEPNIEIAAISGTSAGALNGAVLVNGFIRNGAQGAQEDLERFWKSVSSLGAVVSPFKRTPYENNHSWNLDWSLSYSLFDVLTRFYSPYELNPLNLNPLRTVLERILDLDALSHESSPIKLFVAATSVRNGQPRVFSNPELTLDVLLASACIPFLFQAVEVEGEPYWDGGYMGNPVLWPLIYANPIQDILLVQLNPLYRHQTPILAADIINRLNEITFNSSLMAEMRAINFVGRLIKQGRLDSERYKDIRMHMIVAPIAMEQLNASSKLNTYWSFFEHLHDMGWEAADKWLLDHPDAIGHHSTINIQETFLEPKVYKGKDS